MVAEWRVRVHASRRRVMLIITVIVRLMRGKMRMAPVPRLDHFDFAIYHTLGLDWIKVMSLAADSCIQTAVTPGLLPDQGCCSGPGVVRVTGVLAAVVA